MRMRMRMIAKKLRLRIAKTLFVHVSLQQGVVVGVKRLVVTGNVLPFLMAFRVSLVIPTRRSGSARLLKVVKTLKRPVRYCETVSERR